MHAKLKKKYGQNFLIDKNILNKIYNLIIHNNLNILEIGPGSGNLTEYILKSKPLNLTTIEIDSDLIEDLKVRFINEPRIKILEGDILKNNDLLQNNFDLVISNLPYNISSQILIDLTISSFRPKKMILMFQKEFAQKLLEVKLNALNSVIRCFYQFKKKFEISKNSYYPIPKINSAIVEFSKLDKPLIPEDEINRFIEFKRKIFNKKRKTIGSILKNNHKKVFNPSIYKKRAENLTLEEFIDFFFKTNI